MEGSTAVISLASWLKAFCRNSNEAPKAFSINHNDVLAGHNSNILPLKPRVGGTHDQISGYRLQYFINQILYSLYSDRSLHYFKLLQNLM